MLQTIMGMAAKKTFADIAVLGEDTHVELIRGELMPKAAPSLPHGQVELGLGAMLHRRFNRAGDAHWPGGWWIASEVHVGYETHEVYCHDLVGWRRDRIDGKPSGWPVKTRPDWVCEILSRGHERRDRVEKQETLHAAGVPHYWLVNHDEKILQVYRHEPTGYLLVKSFPSGATIRAEPFDSVELRTGVIFGDEEDEP